MAKAFIPKVNYEDIDLADYGGCGIMRIKAMTVGASSELSRRLQELAAKDGFTLADIERRSDEFDRRYTWDMIFLTIELCTEYVDDDGTTFPLEYDEIRNMSPDFAKQVYDIITRLNQFPLEQTGGAESKKELSKPTEEA